MNKSKDVILKHNGFSVSDPSIIAEVFHNYFSNAASDAKQKKTCFFKIKNHRPKKTVFLWFFIIIYNLEAGKCFLILWSAYSCYIQVVKHYIQYVNCIFIDSVTNYLMNYNTNLHSNIKLYNYNL